MAKDVFLKGRLAVAWAIARPVNAVLGIAMPDTHVHLLMDIVARKSSVSFSFVLTISETISTTRPSLTKLIGPSVRNLRVSSRILCPTYYITNITNILNISFSNNIV